MKSFTETEIKYLAGLLDADGCLYIRTYRTTAGNEYLRLELSLAASESIDRKGYIKTLGIRAGRVERTVYDNNWSPSQRWRVGKMSELNQLLPRLLKHIVIKAKHWETLYNFYLKNKGKDLSGFDIRNFSNKSRRYTGPLKPKKHPTWAWVAGYLDGDVYYSFKGRKIKMGAVCQESDIVALNLLQKAFGGYIRNSDYPRWSRNLGPRDRSFALKFLSKVVNHSRLKRWKIEQILAFHNQSQRLSELPSKEEAIV